MSYQPLTSREYFTLGRYAYDELRRAIISLRLEPGQWVSESELTTLLGMSRTPVREAIRALHREELVEVLPQRGIKIALISMKKIEEVRVVREVLESEALREAIAALQHTPALWEETAENVIQCLEAQRRAARQGDLEGFLAADEAFHREIAGPSRNDTLNAVVRQMRAHLNRTRMLSMRELHNMDALIDEHDALFHAVGERDAARGLDILTHHVRRLQEDLPRVKERYPHYFGP
ncbi:MAG: GntR family transcriptional regulator [Firmicutes bacterium]|nr:GntR family transcriptional regulator [Bacillota bacterium]